MVGGLDAADADDGSSLSEARADCAHDLESTRAQRRSAQPAGAQARRRSGLASPARETVVFVATTPSSSTPPRPRAAPRAASSRSGAIFTRSGTAPPRAVRTASAASSARARSPLHRAQVLRVRRRDVDDHEVGDCAHRAKAREVVRDRRLDGVDGDARDLPIEMPTGTPTACAPPRARSRGASRAAPSLGKPRRLTSARSSGRRNMLGAGWLLRAAPSPCRARRARSRAPPARAGARAFLSKPPARPRGRGT